MSVGSFKLSNDYVTWYARTAVVNEPSLQDFFQLKELGDNAQGIYERFVKFHTENPHIYQLFLKFAVEVQKAGHERYSADAIMHRIRWECDIVI